MAASSIYTMRRNSADDRRSFLAPKRPHPTPSGLYTDTSLNTHSVVVPSQSNSPAVTILNKLFNLGCQSYRKLSPTSCPCYGQMFSAQTHPYSSPSRHCETNIECIPTSCTQVGITKEQSFDHCALASHALSSIILWHTRWRYYLSIQLHYQLTRRHFSRVYWNFESSLCSKFHGLLSPLLVKTLASCANIIPQDSLSFSELSSLQTKHSKTQHLATDVAMCNEIHSDTNTGSATTQLTMYESNQDLCDLEEEIQGEDSYHSECDSEDEDGDDDDGVIFSNELDDTELEQHQEEKNLNRLYSSCSSKLPSRALMTLLSEESGFGESSVTESYSDEEWDDEEQENENLVCESDNTWKIFEAQALSPMPTITPKECPSPNQPQTLDSRHSQSSSKPSCLSHRLSSFNVCAQRHKNCCSPQITPSDNDSPVSKRHRKVSFVSDEKLVNVHCIVVWNFAYRSCRKGPWEQYARDRMHFRCRIDRVGSVIEPCLQKKLECMRLNPPG